MPPRGKDPKFSFLFPDLILVKDDLVVPEVLELKSLKGRNDLLAVVAFMKNAKGEDKDRILLVNGLHRVVSALVNVDDVFPKIG